MKKIFVILVAVALMLSLIPATAAVASVDNGYCDSAVIDPTTTTEGAPAIITVGADWSVTDNVPPAFFWSPTNPIPQFQFSCDVVARIDVTDVKLKGDQFRVNDYAYDYDSGIITVTELGVTSDVTVADGSEDDPEAAFNDPTYSSESFYVEPGFHIITIEAINDSASSGKGYIRVMVATPSPEEAIADLVATITAYNIQQGINNSLDSKLQNVLDSLTATNADQRADAVNKLGAFINTCEAQSDNKLTIDQANILIEKANAIIELLQLA